MQTRSLVFIKNNDKYIFVFDEDKIPELLASLVFFAFDSELNLNEDDAIQIADLLDID